MKLHGKLPKDDDMNRFMTLWVTGRSENDQPLTKAARVALEVDPTPRFMHWIVDHDGQPIEIPEAQTRSQIQLPLEAAQES